MSDRKILYIPSPLHVDAYPFAESLNFNLLLPGDPRVSHWEDIVDAVALRQGRVVGDLRKAKKLKIIARNGTGYEMVDTALCKELGIAVTSLPGFNAEAVAEACLALMLSVSRRIVETNRKMAAGQSLTSMDYVSRSLSNSTVGLVGQGAIARQVALKLNGAFPKCRILVYSPTSPMNRWTEQDDDQQDQGPVIIQHKRCQTLEELLQESDIVSLHCPLVPETRQMIGRAQFEQMKSTGILVNTGRGGLVDEEALADALESNQIFGAALDCLQTEPASAKTNKTYERLFKHERLVAVPHIGATTEEVSRESTIRAVQNCRDWLDGKFDQIDHRVV